MKPVNLLLLLLGSATFLSLCLADPNWPKPTNLLGFWPFEIETGTDGFAGFAGGPMDVVTGAALNGKDGPFGEPYTSYSVLDDGTFIGYKTSFLPYHFTVSFYFFTNVTGRGGIFSFWDGPRFSMNYVEPDELEFGHPVNARIKGIFKPNSWNFVAVTFDGWLKRLNIFDENGDWKAVVDPAPIQVDPPNIDMMVGYTHWCVGASCNGTYRAAMKTGDAIACLMVYTEILSGDEIKQLREVCRTRGGTKVTSTLGTTTPQKVATTTTPVPITTTTQRTTVTETVKTTPAPPVTPWPRPRALLGLWPLNAVYNWRDVGPNSFNGEPSQISPSQLTTGPFGDDNTGVTPKTLGETLFQVQNPRLSIAGSSFTVGFFLRRSTGKGQGGIFEFLDKGNSKQLAWQLRYENETTIEVGANGVSVGHLEIIQPKQAWTFVAFVFEYATALLTVYSRNGVVLPPTLKPQLKNSLAYSNNGIRLGYASKWSQGLQLNDAVSCLSIYSAALTGAEIRQLFDACRVLHGSAPCGTPKLPLLPIPASTTTTTVPKAGQFPYVAALVSATNKCSATIIDPFWLVTSSQCFVDSKNASVFKIYVGKHDLAITESHAREHAVSKIILSGSSSRDIALVQVVEPIDFTNEYVNDVCLFRQENVGDMKLDATQFVFGWGENGRQAFLSQTLPRYVPGQMMAEKECLQAWGNDYTATKDYCFMSASSDKNVPCSGDEGSPLLIQSPADPKTGTGDHLVQAGIYYKRDKECSAGKPGLFVNVAEYRKWISENIACAVPGVLHPDKCPQP